MAALLINCYPDAELNSVRLVIKSGDTPVETATPGFFAATTRITLLIDVESGSDLVIDSDTAPSGTFDWTTAAAASTLVLFLGRAVTITDPPPAGKVLAPVKGKYLARLDFYQGTDNAVISHDQEKTLRVAIWDKKAGVG